MAKIVESTGRTEYTGRIDYKAITEFFEGEEIESALIFGTGRILIRRSPKRKAGPFDGVNLLASSIVGETVYGAALELESKEYASIHTQSRGYSHNGGNKNLEGEASYCS